jgi:hypothetical protein
VGESLSRLRCVRVTATETAKAKDTAVRMIMIDANQL